MSATMLAIAGLGPTELIVIVLAIVLLFGATKLPQLAKALGQSKRAFKEGLDEGEREPTTKEIKEQFLNSPLVAEFLMPSWLALVREEMRADLSREISRLINEERHEAEFALSVKATLVVGQKDHSH